uniref:Uncharacterized protein n=1 Tax=Peronospora matthiolae TaxID=2874970 RepID=A0AAV1VAA0_9STRA
MIKGILSSMLQDSVRLMKTPVTLILEVVVVTQELRDQRGFRRRTLPHDSLDSVSPPPPPPLEDSRGGQRFLIKRM